MRVTDESIEEFRRATAGLFKPGSKPNMSAIQDLHNHYAAVRLRLRARPNPETTTTIPIVEHEPGAKPVSVQKGTQLKTNGLAVVPREPPGLEIINEVVGRFYKVSKTDFCSHRRSKHLVRARQIAMYLAKVLTLRSYPEIARLIGDRDHTTCMHAYRKIMGLINHDDRLRDELDLLEIKIRERVANPPKCCPTCGVWS